MLKKFPKKDRKWLHILLLSGWLVIGVGLRFAHLEEKSLSSIEVSTLGFSLGRGFQEVPLERVISLDTLLSPLQSFPTTSWREVVARLASESNHPPLYFLLTHWWLNLLELQGESALVWEGRSLSAIFGAASIPAIFGLGWLAFRSLLVGQIAAALMAVSPYGIYLAQEARHYTLTILWIIASLSCLFVAISSVERRTHLPISIACIWIVVNSLGIATHYFFALALCAEGCVISAFWLRDCYSSKSFPGGYWWRIYAVIAGTASGCLVWFPAVTSTSHNELTDWIATDFDLDEIWQPIPRLLGWWITMAFLLPVEGTNLPVTLLSGLVLLTVLLWVFPALIRGWRTQIASLSSRLAMQVLGGFLVGAIAIFLVIIYGLAKDLSLAARYHFVYFPALIVLLGAVLAICWQESNGRNWQARGKKVVVAILVMGLLGALTVTSNYGYQKSQRADLLADYIQARSPMPVSIAMTYETHAELRKLISVGMEFERSQDKGIKPKFLLVQRKKDGSQTLPPSLTTALEQISQPLALWAVDLKIDSRELEALNCEEEKASHPHISGYKYQLYHCP